MKRANWKKAGISAVSAFGLVAASVVAGSGVANAQEMGGAAGAQNAPIVGKAPAIHERSGISVKAVIPVQPLAGQAYTCAFQAGPHGLLIEPSLAEGGCKIYGIPVYDTGGEQTYEVIVGFPGSNYPEERRVGSYYIGKNVAPAPGGAAENLGDAKGEADDSRGGEGEAEGVQPGNDALNDLDGDKDGVSDASDLCPLTEKGAPVDDKGCAKGPTVEDGPAVLEGSVGEFLGPHSWVVINDGMLKVQDCVAENLPNGLKVSYGIENASGQTVCSLSGTPQEAFEGKVKISLNYASDADGSIQSTPPAVVELKVVDPNAPKAPQAPQDPKGDDEKVEPGVSDDEGANVEDGRGDDEGAAPGSDEDNAGDVNDGKDEPKADSEDASTDEGKDGEAPKTEPETDPKADGDSGEEAPKSEPKTDSKADSKADSKVAPKVERMTDPMKKVPAGSQKASGKASEKVSEKKAEKKQLAVTGSGDVVGMSFAALLLLGAGVVLTRRGYEG